MAMASERLSVTIAGITITVTGSIPFARFNDFPFYRDFITGAPRSGGVDCRLDLTVGPMPDLCPGPDPFTADNWQLSALGDKKMLRIGPPPRRGRPDNIVVFDDDYSSGAMHQTMVFELFRRFIDQFLMINLLSQRSGFLLHASGVIWDGKAIAFVGRSGVGKSTLLDLFKDEVSREHLLNDDRLAVRKCDGGWRLYGTPWYGESRVSSSGSAPLQALFFIDHAKHNYVKPLPNAEVCRRLLPTGLMPVWDPPATARVLETFQDLVGTVPAYEFGFLPDKSALELITQTIQTI